MGRQPKPVYLKGQRGHMEESSLFHGGSSAKDSLPALYSLLLGHQGAPRATLIDTWGCF